MADETADVVIVGAGAAGAALAWSLAETRMNIVCLEQGDWMDPAQYPTTGTDWEMRQFGDFGLSQAGLTHKAQADNQDPNLVGISCHDVSSRPWLDGSIRMS